MPPYAVVAVDDPHARPDQAHHYAIPTALFEALRPGCLVIVPFGRRLRRGRLLQFADTTPVAETRDLVAALPEAPRPTEGQIALAHWLSRRAHIPLARALALALPEATQDAALPRLKLGLAAPAAPAAARALLARLRRGPLRVDRAWLLLPADHAGLLAELLASGALERVGPPRAPGAAAAAPAAVAAPAPLPARALDRAGRELCGPAFADMTNRRGGIFLVTSPRWPLAALEQLIQHALANGHQALLLLPRPSRQAAALRGALARFPQALVLTQRSAASFGGGAQAALVIGGRWAALLPFADLGLVVVLDEHDPAYAGERAPFVHGRELALQAARLAGATAVLCSPTPDPATLWRAQRARVRRFDLDAAEPVHARLVDLRQELRSGRGTLLSEPLRAALGTTLAAGGRGILLLNRRGSAAVLLCRRCGSALQCARCSAPYAYHAEGRLLRCHLCNAAAPRPEACPRCRLPTLDELGAGVQRLAQEVQAAFPAARLARWDRDATEDAGDRAAARRFAAGELDLLVGTQLVALAAELPPVALAAAVLADVGLHLPDYRAAERSFELLSALRRRVAPGGTLLLQTYHPGHWALQAVTNDDPARFYGEELRRRRELGYPPFTQLARLTCRGTSRGRCEAEALRLRDVLAARLAEIAPGLEGAILGPAPAHVEQVRGVYRWQLHLRAPNLQPLLEVVPPHWLVEVDPEGLR